MQSLESLKNITFKILTSRGTGTGFYISESDIVLTNHHVVNGCKEVAIEDDKMNRMYAKVILINPDFDIAILKVDEDLGNSSSFVLGHELELSRQQKVYALGYPFGMPFTITEGIISNPRQHMNGKYFVQTDAAINPGNSGGPLVTEQGQLVGINSSKFNNADNVGFAIPLDVVNEIVSAVKENEKFEFSLQCSSCSSLTYNAQSFCNNCGNTLDKDVFDEVALNEFSSFMEDTIQKLDINPVLTRAGHEFWEFHQGSSLIRIFVRGGNYLYLTSPMNTLPNKNLESLFEYLVSSDQGEFSLGVQDNTIYISYRIHMSDIFKNDASKSDIKEKIKALILKADELDDFFVDEYGCSMSTYSRVVS